VPLVIADAWVPDVRTINRVIEHLIRFHEGWNDTTARQIRNAYPSDAYKTQASRLTTLGTDFCFRCGTRTAARALAAQGIDTYLYQYDHQISFLSFLGPASEFCQLDDELLCGVFHASELPFVFSNPLSQLTEADRTVASTMGALWTNFAKSGNPNGDGVDVTWPVYTAAADQHLRIASTLEVGTGFAKLNCDFWSTLPHQRKYPH